jgi:hypothetical protein
MKLNNWVKAILVIICLGVSVAGFLIKLPSAFRHIDKEMHSLFYFLAAAFLNILFANKNIIRHAVIFIILYLFGMAIEYAQEYSNTFLHKKIHGRYDPEDIRYNLKGLMAFSALWFIVVAVLFVYNKTKLQKSGNQPAQQ